MNAPGHTAREACSEQPWPPRYLTVTEAAAAMSRHRSAVLRLIHTGKLRSIRLGRSYRVREAEVPSLLAGPMPGPPGMLDAAECARILRCPERTIHALVKLGHLDGEGSGTGSCRVAVSEFQRFLRDAERLARAMRTISGLHVQMPERDVQVLSGPARTGPGQDDDEPTVPGTTPRQLEGIR